MNEKIYLDFVGINRDRRTVVNMESKMIVFRILFSITVMFIGSALSQVTSQNYDCGSTSSQTPVPPFFLPFGPASGDGQLPPSDNGGVKVELNTRFPFFTEAYKDIYVSK